MSDTPVQWSGDRNAVEGSSILSLSSDHLKGSRSDPEMITTTLCEVPTSLTAVMMQRMSECVINYHVTSSTGVLASGAAGSITLEYEYSNGLLVKMTQTISAGISKTWTWKYDCSN